jgi:hypothetical protein
LIWLEFQAGLVFRLESFFKKQAKLLSSQAQAQAKPHRCFMALVLEYAVTGFIDILGREQGDRLSTLPILKVWLPINMEKFETNSDWKLLNELKQLLCFSEEEA